MELNNKEYTADRELFPLTLETALKAANSRDAEIKDTCPYAIKVKLNDEI